MSRFYTMDTLARETRAMCLLPLIVVRRIRFVMRKPELGECWEVNEGWNSGNGYAKCRHRGRSWLAHRLAYTLAFGEVAKKLLLDHHCENRACIRPAHLEPVTTQVNTKRGRAVLFRPVDRQPDL